MKFKYIILLISAIALISFLACDKNGADEKSFIITIDGTLVEFPVDSVWVTEITSVGGQIFEAINEDYWIQIVNTGDDFTAKEYNFSNSIPSGIFYIVATNSYENFTEGSFIIEEIDEEGKYFGTLNFKTPSTTATEGEFKNIDKNY